MHEPIDGAARHNFLWPIICLRLLPIVVNWYTYSLWRSLNASDNVLINAALRSDLLATSPVLDSVVNNDLTLKAKTKDRTFERLNRELDI